MAYQPIKLNVDGLTRIIRNVRFQSENDIECVYKGHEIEVNAQDTGGCYAKVWAPDGCYIVDGYFSQHDPIEVLAICLSNILS